VDTQFFTDYFNASTEHRKEHKCGGAPFDHGHFLTDLAADTQAKKVLEIGTAIGFSAYCFASASPDLHVTTIDLQAEHGDLAHTWWNRAGVESQITFHEGRDIDVLAELDDHYDIIFFDGFSPRPESVAHYLRLISPSGVVITSNLYLPAERDTTDEYLETLEVNDFVTYAFRDTAVSSLDMALAHSSFELLRRQD
jgi:predicted O-methyltransferase YrrM